MLALTGLMLTACDPHETDYDPKGFITSEELTNSLVIEAQSEGNNNITVYTSPTRYIKVYDAETSTLLAEGTLAKIQVAPPQTELTVYATTMNEDGEVIQSGTKSITISEYTDLPEIYTQVFGDGNGGYTTTKWGWDTTDNDGVVWGNGGYLENTTPGWWTVTADQIDEQATSHGLENDGLDGWFTLSLTGVTTSRGETGSVTVNEETVKTGWDIGTMTFSNTIPLMGILVNYDNQRQYEYHILKADGTHLYLCAPEPGAGDWGTAWFWCFKKQ